VSQASLRGEDSECIVGWDWGDHGGARIRYAFRSLVFLRQADSAELCSHALLRGLMHSHYDLIDLDAWGGGFNGGIISIQVSSDVRGDLEPISHRN
jgi:hypothetical protein